MNAIMCCFFLCSPLRSSFVSVAFDFSASLNDVAPPSLMSFPVDLLRINKVACWRMLFCVVSFVFTPQIELTECCVWFQCITHWCCSCVSNVVTFCFYKNKKKRELLMNAICVVCFVLTIQIEFRECCVWFQSITQWCRSCFSNLVSCWFDENGKECFVNDAICMLFFCLHHSDQIDWVLCLISVHHSMM